MSTLSRGLLAAFGGAVGGAEQYIQQENEFERKKSLEDYRLEKERELAMFKHQLDLQLSGWKHGVDVSETLRKEEFESEQADLDRANRVEVAKVGADARAAKGDSTVAWEVNNAVKSVAPDLRRMLGDDFADFDTGGLPNDADGILSALSEIDDARAYEAASIISEFLSLGKSMTKSDVDEFRARIRSLGGEVSSKSSTDRVQESGFTILGKKKG